MDIENSNHDLIDKAIQKAVKTALLKHKHAGNSVAVWRDGKVVLLKPEEILTDDVKAGLSDQSQG